MASGTIQPKSGGHPPPRSQPRGGRVIEYQQFIDGQLRKTRGRVKWVDLWTGLTVLAIGVTAYLMLAVVVDHWLVPGGLGFAGRLLLLLGLAAGVVAHIAVRIVPSFFRKVNPVFAAAAIERSQPMKNSLINFLLLRKQSSGVAEPVLDAMKEQAAVRLSGVSEEAPVDRTSLIRWGCALAAVLIVAVVYTVVVGKNTFDSIARVIAPWNDRLEAPTWVKVVAFTPGDVQIERDQKVVVSVTAEGVRPGDQAVVYFSPTGRRADDVAVPMRSDDRRQWQATLPPQGGFKQDAYYYVKIGDATLAGATGFGDANEVKRYRIHVPTVPVINVEGVHYKYPPYTKLGEKVASNIGDIQAIEGTIVTVTAKADERLKAAQIEFDQSGGAKLELAVEETGLRAAGQFTLALKDDRTTPTHKSYVVRMVNVDNRVNPKPPEYKISVGADKSPEVKITQPATPPEKEIAVAAGQWLPIALSARDLDFRLAEAALVFERQGKVVREEKAPAELIAALKEAEVLEWPVVVDAAAYGFRPGERIALRARATDNKSPRPNTAWSATYTLVITPPQTGAQQLPPNAGRQPQPPNNNAQNQPQTQQRPNDGTAGGDRQPQNTASQNNQPGNQPGNNGGQNPMPADGQQLDAGKPDAGKPGEHPPGNVPQPPEKQPSANPQQSGKQPDGQRPNEQQNASQPEQNQPTERQPIDPNVDPGGALDAANDFFNQQDQQQGANQKPQDQTADKSQPNAKQPEGNQEGGGAGKRAGNEPGNQGNDSSGGQPGGTQPSTNDAPGTPGAAEHMKPGTQQPGAGERQPGATGDNAQETARKPGDQAAAGNPNAAPKTGNEAPAGQPKSTDTQNANDGGAKPNNGNLAQPNAGPKPGEGMQQQPGEGSQPPPGGQTNPGSPTPNQTGNQSNEGDSGGTRGSSPKPGDQNSNKQPGGEAGKPSVNTQQGAGSEKTPGSNTQSGNEGSPESQRPVKPRERTGSESIGNEKEEAKSPNNEGRQESNAQGQTSGDQLGKGQEGGGQSSNQQGTGAGGSNTPGDTGSGAADQTGDAAPSQDPGEKMRASAPSGGRPGEQAGDGSASREGGNDAGGASQPSPGTQQPKAGAPPPGNSGTGGNERRPSDGSAAGPADDRGSPDGNETNERGAPGPGGGGGVAEGNQAAPPRPKPEVGADPANLEYARQVTELTLERLKTQLDRGEVDPELLKRFSSREALEQFVRRWDELRRSANQAGPAGDAARQTYQDSLESLGLRPQVAGQQARRGDDDGDRSLRSGRRSEPPVKYAEQYRAYINGVGQPRD